jgi:hypothetical protein
MSAMTAPYLHFWSKRRFVGNNTKEVFVSSNYTGDVNTATWVNFNINFNNLDTIYSAFNNTDLTAYKAAPFHIAFKYVSSAAGTADEWSIDDVSITDGPLSVKSFEQANLKFSVLGQPADVLNLLVESDKNEQFDLVITDMTGHTIVSTRALVTSGKNKISVDLPAVANGLYFVNISNAQVKGAMKFIKQ